jgi:hypothetical protein
MEGRPSGNVFKCRLKPLSHAFFHREYGPALSTAAQWSRLSAAFPSGVCDWSKRGVEESNAIGLTFQAGRAVFR